MGKTNYPIGNILRGVYLVEEDTFLSDELSLQELSLFFEDTDISIKIHPVTDTDEIEVVELSYVQPHLTKPPTWIKPYIGKKLQTVWETTNTQRYFDQIIFAFEYLNPSFSLVSEGSVLKVYGYKPILK